MVEVSNELFDSQPKRILNHLTLNMLG